ncbi:hypothetical protein ACXYMO_05520 [Arenibacterium sp. CAU 1754]
MFAFNVLVHAAKMIFHDFWTSVRITFIPYFLGMILAFGAGYLIAGPEIQAFFGASLENAGMTGRMWLAILAATLIVMLAFFWAAVAWHRYGLLAEQPEGFMPAVNGRLIWSYFMASLRIGLVFIGLLIPAGLILYMSSFLGPGAVIGGILFAIVMIVLVVMVFRMSLILPAAAIDKPLTIRGALDATRGYFWHFILLGIFTSLISQLGDSVSGAGIFGLVLFILINWFNFALGLSILTTLYGVLVEGRDLD